MKRACNLGSNPGIATKSARGRVHTVLVHTVLLASLAPPAFYIPKPIWPCSSCVVQLCG